jgi:hypothetical protein
VGVGIAADSPGLGVAVSTPSLGVISGVGVTDGGDGDDVPLHPDVSSVQFAVHVRVPVANPSVLQVFPTGTRSQSSTPTFRNPSPQTFCSRC